MRLTVLFDQVLILHCEVYVIDKRKPKTNCFYYAVKRFSI